MKKTILLATAVTGLAALAACHGTTTTNTTTTNTLVTTDNMGMANTMMTGADAALNQANATIATGQNVAKDLTTHDPDMNLANGM